MTRVIVLTAAVLLVSGCLDGSPENDGGNPATDAGADAAVLDAGADAGPGSGSDAGADAGAGPFDAGPLTLVIYPRVGNASDSTATPQGPGLVLMGGGTDVDSSFVWMQATLAGGASGRVGDVVVLRATGSNAYDAYLVGLAPFNSVQTVRLPAPSSGADLAAAAAIVDRAEAVFFAGGNQADYVAWRGSPLMASVQALYERGGVVGGTSAGLAILGQFSFDAIAAGSGSVVTADAVADPYLSTISFTTDLLHLPPLVRVITDSHFQPRDRFGRLTAFMARLLADGAVPGAAPVVIGVGVDEKNALVVDKAGVASLRQQAAGVGAAFIIRGGPATQVQAGSPLEYSGLTVMRIDSPSQRYDFGKGCGTGVGFSASVSGSLSGVYTPANPYAAAGSTGVCP